jgi:integrase
MTLRARISSAPPEHVALTQRVLAIPRKRAAKRAVTFLTPVETQALVDAPTRSTWAGRRDHALLLTAVQTGLRISELLGGVSEDLCRRDRKEASCLRERTAGPSTTAGDAALAPRSRIARHASPAVSEASP